jgi:hypothetical protein
LVSGVVQLKQECGGKMDGGQLIINSKNSSSICSF